MLLNHELTTHADKRMRQRGLRDGDMQVLLEAASQVSPDAYLLTAEDVAREIAQHKRDIQRLERLKGSKVIVQGGTVVTVYHATRASQKRAMRTP